MPDALLGEIREQGRGFVGALLAVGGTVHSGVGREGTPIC
jgi:hypothetical protein